MAQQQNAPKFDDSADLYAQIAASDQADAPKKQKNSLIMNIMVGYMRMTLRLDEQRRKYERLFRVLSNFWMGIMACLYLCGLVMFFILVGSYFRFPSEVEKYLAQNGILYDKKEIPGYIFSQVNLYGLHDKEKTYKIDKVSLASTFADFLNKRAKNLSLSGVDLQLETAVKEGGDILSVIAKLNNKASGGVGVRIDSLDVSDAKILIKGSNYSIPVSVSSLSGMYGADTRISAYVKIAEPYLNMEGTITVRKVQSKTTWELSFQDGRVIFPNQPSQRIDGKITLETSAGKVSSVEAHITLFYEKLQKVLLLKLNQMNDGFDGKLTLTWADISDAKKPVNRTAINLDLQKLKITPAGLIETESPIDLTLTSKYMGDVQIENLTTQLMGKLSCQLLDYCTYDLTSNATVSIKDAQLPIRGDLIRNEVPFSLTLKPVSKMVDLAFKSGDLNVNTMIERLSLRGKGVDNADKVNLVVGSANITSRSNLWAKLLNINLSADNISYKTPAQDINQGKLAIQNMFDPTELITLESPRVIVKDNRYLKEAFSIKYTTYQNQTRADVRLENRQARVMFDGYLDLNGGVIDGILVIPTIQLSQLKQPLNRISDLIPAGLKKVSGNITGYGHLSGNLRTGVYGPFYLALSDVGVKTEHLTVNRINTALTISSFAPLISETNQHVYIGQVDSFFPITDIRFDIQLGDKFAQVSDLHAMMMGIPLVSEAVLMPYRNIPTIIYFKNKDYDLTSILKGIDIKDWTVSGSSQGSILFPLEVKDFVVKLKSATIQLMNATLTHQGKDAPAFMDGNKQMFIRSGSVVIDEGEGKDVQANVVMDVSLMPSNQKKSIRETYTGSMDNILTVKQEKASQVPEDILTKIREIQDKTSVFLNK